MGVAQGRVILPWMRQRVVGTGVWPPCRMRGKRDVLTGRRPGPAAAPPHGGAIPNAKAETTSGVARSSRDHPFRWMSRRIRRRMRLLPHTRRPVRMDVANRRVCGSVAPAFLFPYPHRRRLWIVAARLLFGCLSGGPRRSRMPPPSPPVVHRYRHRHGPPPVGCVEVKVPCGTICWTPAILCFRLLHEGSIPPRARLSSRIGHRDRPSSGGQKKRKTYNGRAVVCDGDRTMKRCHR